MGSLEDGAGAGTGGYKRGHPPPPPSPLLRSVVGPTRRGSARSRLARFLLFEKVDYLQWIGTAAAFFFVTILVVAFLPGSAVFERPTMLLPSRRAGGGAGGGRGGGAEALLPRGLGVVETGEGVAFEPTRLRERWARERREEADGLAKLGSPVRRFGVRKPRLAMVFGDLSPGAMQLQMVSVASVLEAMGYEMKVFTFKDGPCTNIWRTIGVTVDLLPEDTDLHISVDWLDYDGILLNSIEARPEPFKSIPVIWNVQESSLAHRISEYNSSGMIQILDGWKEAFSRANVIVFPNYVLPVMYAAFDSGNYFVIPGSPAVPFQDRISAKSYDQDVRVSMGLSPSDFVISIVGSQFSYGGFLMEEALVLQAVGSLLQQYPSENSTQLELKVRILAENVTEKHRMALEAVSLNVGFPRGAVEHVASEDKDSLLGISDLVIYGSCLNEQSFPSVLVQAMCLEKLVIAPDLEIIRKYIDDGMNALLFPSKNIGKLTQVLLQAVSNGKISVLGQKIASAGKVHAKNLMASETIEGYAVLLENVIKFPAEVLTPLTAGEIPVALKQEWKWHLFEDVKHLYHMNGTLAGYNILQKLEEKWRSNQMEDHHRNASKIDDTFSLMAWEEERADEIANIKKRLEEEELKERSEQPHGTWEEVYRNVKRVERMKNDLHERDDKELERTGQPLSIYEPFFGEGTWPFLHRSSLYRGIGLSSKGRRPGADDIDASSRLPLLNNGYYRDILGEFGAFFALANRIDRIHKNSWIGFQSWRVTARKANLSKKAETALLEAIQTQKHGDAFYFWVRMDQDERNLASQDFWSFCDAINAGNCRSAVLKAFQRMYGVQLDDDLHTLPLMPNDGDTWSVMQSWVLPTRSFLEFVMFSRMFVDALDAQMYDKHHETGHCILSLHRDQHCYSRVLELIVNVWAFHSSRRMVYVDPETGAMQEQHLLNGRRGQMSIQLFSFATLKSMDEDLAEEFDEDHPDRRWLWPKTGEVFWQGVYERERNMRQQEKERRKQQSKDKIQRIKKRARQKTLGRYIKPPPEDAGSLNDTRTVDR
uniref:Glycosyl transferase family 1 domain-containing protein n=1 Tax=Oryza meridionalis TaxID=40149 RepID=A0A0E0C4S5_9ORYZ